MGALYRSEEMTRCQLFLQTEAAYACVAELGELGLVQFRDLNPDVSAFQRKFVNEVRRCDEMERKLRYLEREIKKDGIPMLDTGENPDAPQPREMIDLEATFEKLENELREVNSNEEMLKKNFLELTELKHILRKTQAFFDEAEHGVPEPAGVAMADRLSGMLGVPVDADDRAILITAAHDDRPGMKLGFVAGVIFREKLPAFERLLWRACHGNVFLRTAEIDESLEDPTTGDQVHKSVFIIFFQGEQLKSRVKKICEGFRATLYPCPETPAERREMAIGVMTRIEDLKTVLGQTQDHRHRVLVAAAKNIRLWFVKVQKIKAIYHTLNLFNLDVTQKCLIAECWCPVADLEKIQLALKRGTEESGSTVPSILHRMQTSEPPPTYFRTNKFTQGFQSIVDAYGIATYQEINPAPYTIITFPFLFAVMFGDIGHGLIMFLFALFLVLKEKMLQARKIQDEIFQTFFSGRYIILLMGIFSIYTGLIYNDIFSRSINIFGTGWRVNATRYGDGSALAHMETAILDPATGEWTGSAYPLGIDPIWNLAENKLLFLNSFKMKMSVIMGIFQMLFGVLLSLMNYRYFKQQLNIYCQFIPQLIFLSSIFVYLCIMIFYKWTHFGPHPSGAKDCYIDGSRNCYEPTCAPSLLIGLINMFMFASRPSGPYRHKDTMGPGGYQSSSDCANNSFYSGQNGFEQFLVVVAFFCIPVMLFAKPYMMNKQRLQRLSQPLSVHADMSNGEAEVVQADGKPVDATPELVHGDGHGGHDGEFSFGDIFIHQAIHTIEFCLGCVSHTASYLRLWALSLAHAELSEVLWEMVLKQAFTMVRGYGGAIVTYVIFFAFAVLTVAILVVMEGLSAFLHALRLHWVEFNSKFYQGDGHMFMPFSFDVILEQARTGLEEKQ